MSDRFNKLQGLFDTIGNLQTQKAQDPNSWKPGAAVQNVQKQTTQSQSNANVRVDNKSNEAANISSTGGMSVNWDNTKQKSTPFLQSVASPTYQSTGVAASTANPFASTGGQGYASASGSDLNSSLNSYLQNIDAQSAAYTNQTAATKAQIAKERAARADQLGQFATDVHGQLDTLGKTKSLGEIGTKSALENQSSDFNRALDQTPSNSNVGILGQMFQNYDPRLAAIDSNVYQGNINDLRGQAGVINKESDQALSNKAAALSKFGTTLTEGNKNVDTFANDTNAAMDRGYTAQNDALDSTEAAAQADLIAARKRLQQQALDQTTSNDSDVVQKGASMVSSLISDRDAKLNAYRGGSDLAGQQAWNQSVNDPTLGAGGSSLARQTAADYKKKIDGKEHGIIESYYNESLAQLNELVKRFGSADPRVVALNTQINADPLFAKIAQEKSGR